MATRQFDRFVDRIPVPRWILSVWIAILLVVHAVMVAALGFGVLVGDEIILSGLVAAIATLGVAVASRIAKAV